MERDRHTVCVCGGIVLLWGAFAGWLVWDEYGGSAQIVELRSELPTLVSLGGGERRMQMGIYYGGGRVGRLVQNSTTTGNRTEITIDIALDLAQVACVSHTSGDTPFLATVACRSIMVDEALQEFSMSVDLDELGAAMLNVHGEVAGETLHMSILQGKRQRFASFPIDPKLGMGFLGCPSGKLKGLRKNQVWRAHLFNPVSLRFESVQARVVGRDEVASHGARLSAHVVQVGGGGLGTRLWIDDQGELLRQSVMGFDLIRERATAAESVHASLGI